MTELLDMAIEAHGGMDRWTEIRSIDLKLSIGGGLWQYKGLPEGLDGVHMHIMVFTDASLDNDVAYSHQNAGRTREVGAFRRTDYDAAERWHDDATERRVVEAVMSARQKDGASL